MARLHDIKEVDLENTYWGVATSLWFNHCPHECFNCWNDETWQKDDGLEIPNDEVVDKTLEYLDSFGMNKTLTLLGGEPFSPYNVKDLSYILKNVKEIRPHTKILSWSGYEFHVLKKSKYMREALQYVDVIVCGRYIDEWNCHGQNKMYGSENQYIVDVKESLRTGETVYIEKGNKFQNLEELSKTKRRDLNR